VILVLADAEEHLRLQVVMFVGVAFLDVEDYVVVPPQRRARDAVALERRGVAEQRVGGEQPAHRMAEEGGVTGGLKAALHPRLKLSRTNARNRGAPPIMPRAGNSRLKRGSTVGVKSLVRTATVSASAPIR
jgi:hypothetical protein